MGARPKAQIHVSKLIESAKEQHCVTVESKAYGTCTYERTAYGAVERK